MTSRTALTTIATQPPALLAHRRAAPPTPLWALAFVAALSGCGGGDDDAIPAASPPAAASTTVTGAVVKGPVSGAQVCAYTVLANSRGSALGSCTTTDASGNYSFAVPAASGPLWVEATGGTYTDEATGASATLPAGSTLRSIVSANAGTVTTMLTPLTTLALNAAAASVGTGGQLDAAAFSAAAAQLLSTFNLPGTLDIAGTLPAFGSGINSYGTALTAISKMVANGTLLASILANANPQVLAAAFATAAAPPAPPPPAPPPPPNGGGSASASASGTVNVGGVTAAGAATSLTPQADGFEVQVTGASTQYRFFRETTSPASKVEIKVDIPLVGNTTVAYYDLANRSSLPFCSSNCGVTVSTASGTTHPVTLTFTNTPLSGGLTLNGSLVGDAPGAAWSQADLAGGTTSSLTLGGTAVRVLSSSDSVTDLGGGNSLRSLTFRLSDGSTLSLSQSNGAAFTLGRISPPASINTCNAACNITVADSTGSTRLTFASTALSGGLVLDGTVDYGRTSGSLTTSDAGNFSPVASTIEALNDRRTLTFNVLGTAAQAGLSLVTVEVQGGRVVRAQATVGIAQQLFTCLDNGAGINVPACSGITLAADGRSVTFSSAVLRGGAVGTPSRDVTFNGTLVAKGP